MWLLASAFACGQTPGDALTSAFAKIRAKPAVTLRAIGSEVKGGVQHTLEVDGCSDIDLIAPRARIKVTSFYDGQFRYGWAADGVQLFHYDPVRNEYSAVIYGSFSGKTPDRLVDSVLQSMVALSKGQAILPIRFLRDVYAGDTLTYKTWIADADPVEIATDTVHTVTYENKSKKLVYALEPKSGDLLSIDWWELKSDGAGGIQVHWTLKLTTHDSTPQSWDFSFTPPPSCRPVPLVKG